MKNSDEPAETSRRLKALAIAALVLGVGSGPAGFGLALLAANNSLDESIKECFGLSLWAASHIGAFVFSWFVWRRAKRVEEGSCGVWARCALIGMVAPPCWVVILVVYLAWALQYADF